MRTLRTLRDEAYAKELDRLRHLTRYPELPALRQQMIRVMRGVTGDPVFLHALITFFVDHGEQCPTPSELSERAGVMRSNGTKTPADPTCAKCGGSGWVQGTKTVTVSGMPSYDMDYSARCQCSLAGASR